MTGLALKFLCRNFNLAEPLRNRAPRCLRGRSFGLELYAPHLGAPPRVALLLHPTFQLRSSEKNCILAACEAIRRYDRPQSWLGVFTNLLVPFPKETGTKDTSTFKISVETRVWTPQILAVFFFPSFLPYEVCPPLRLIPLRQHFFPFSFSYLSSVCIQAGKRVRL